MIKLEPTQAIPRVAIACQGGGSHTAFTAGVLKQIVLQEPQRNYRIMGVSGTSGGAICALLAWYGLLKVARQEWQREQIGQVLKAFWQDNAAIWPWEQLWNSWVVRSVELQTRGFLPSGLLSPYSAPLTWLVPALQAISPRREFFDLKYLLEKYVNFAETVPAVQHPRLLIGAVNVLSGAFKAFDSQLAEISVDAVLASTALPWLVKAVQVDGSLYWDGLFSQNPPIHQFIEHRSRDEKPDEIWVIRINPQTRDEEPRSVDAIEDRRNELAGNLSLNQEIGFIEKINEWLAEGVIQSSVKKTIRLRYIEKSPEMSASLTYTSKMNRSQAFIETLFAHGEAQAEQFLQMIATSSYRV